MKRVLIAQERSALSLREEYSDALALFVGSAGPRDPFSRRDWIAETGTQFFVPGPRGLQTTASGTSQGSWAALPGARVLTHFSLCAVVRGASGQADMRVLALGNSADSAPIVQIGTDPSTGSSVRIWSRDDGTNVPGDVSSAATVFDNTFHNVVFTVARDGTLRLFVDGKQDANSASASFTTFTVDRVGLSCLRRGISSHFFNGDIALAFALPYALPQSAAARLSANPWQILEAPRRVYKAPAAGGAITTGLGQLTITGLAPTVTATAHVSIGSGLGALTLTGLAPRLDLGISSGLGSLVIAGLAPTVSVSENVAISPGLGALTITGLAPSVAVSENVFITSGLGALVLTGLAPQVGDNPNISTGLGALTITGHAPSLSATEHQFATPSAGALAITGLAPDVRQQLYVSIGLATLTINGFAPTVTEAGASITTGLGELVIIGYAPSIQGGEAEVSRGAGRRTKRERYIARYKGEEFEFSTYDDLEEFVQQVKKAEAQKPRKIRKPVRIRLEPSFVEDIREYVDIPAQIYQLPASKALEQVRKLEMSIKKVDDDDEEEIWLILTG